MKKGVPFRDAHEIVGKAVRHGLTHGKELAHMSLDEFRRFSPLIDEDVYAAITVEASLRARAVIGGTAPEAVRREIVLAKELIGQGHPA